MPPVHWVFKHTARLMNRLLFVIVRDQRPAENSMIESKRSTTSLESEITPATRYAYRPRRGLSIPSITVLDSSGRVIEEEQRRVFRHLAQSGKGADILFAGGTTGELNRILND